MSIVVALGLEKSGLPLEFIQEKESTGLDD